MNAVAGGAALTPLQADLLRAAFRADEAAITAWRRWRDAVDWDAHLDHDSFRLLPRVYRNLCRQGAGDPLLPRLKGVARQAWYANQHRLRQFQPTLQALAAAGVEPLLLPPTALLLDDATAVLGRQAPLSCAVRAAAVETAIRCLRRVGWHTAMRLPRWSLGGYVLGANRLAWRDGAGQTLELQWQRDPGDRCGRFPDEVWTRAGAARLVNEPVLALDAADAVHDLCRQPVAGKAFARVVDLLLYVDAAKAPPDWRHVLAHTAQAPVDAAWPGMFDDLRELVPALVPPAAGTAWSAPAPQPAPMPAAATGTMHERIRAHWSVYRQAWGRDYSVAKAVRHLPGYLLARWQLSAPGALPLRLWRGLRCEWRDARRSRQTASSGGPAGR